MKVLVGICGSIAAYKTLELIRRLKKEGAEVKVILTKSALEFVTPLSCQTLSENEVYIDQFVLTKGIKHLTLSEWADIFVIAPASANIIGKAVSGIADDLLSSTIVSFQKPVLFVPAMDQGMWQNKIVKKNVATLMTCQYHFLEPITGPLASGKIGKGRFPPVLLIYKKIITILEQARPLNAKKLLIVGGRTEEDVDQVRVITNRSSGMMARELIDAVICRGGLVKSILGPTTIPFTEGLTSVLTRTSGEMLEAIISNVTWCDCLIMAAAVGDYRPKSKSQTKIHRQEFSLVLEKNQDLLKMVRKYKQKRVFVGFSLEDKDTAKRAREKLTAKKLDFIVLNRVSAIGNEEVTAEIMGENGKITNLGRISKWRLANRILDKCIDALTKEK